MSLNRNTSSYSRSLAHRAYDLPERRTRRRREYWLRTSRKCSKFASLIASEFRAWLLIGTGTFLIAVLLALLFAPLFNVRQITVHRQDPRIDLDEIQQTLSPLFRQRLLLVTKNQVSAMLQIEYPDIDAVEIAKIYPSTLDVTIHVEPVAATIVIDDHGTLFSDSGALAGSGSYSYITHTGTFVTSPIPLALGTTLPTLRLTDWGIRPQNRMKALPPDFIEHIFLARDSLRTDFGLLTQGITVYVRAQEFHIRTNKVVLWFDLKSPLSEQFQRFREFLKTVSLDQVKMYIDLRIVDKIIYQ